MEPVTHMLTGACLSRSGLNRRAAYATLTMVIAAEFPDIDTLWSLRGPIEGFQHHRGITHTFLGLPFEAAFIVAGVYGWHLWRVRRARETARRSGLTNKQGDDRNRLAATDERVVKPLTLAPVRWGVLYGLALVALLSHLLLDYTNNYGLRPFFPFDDRWYAASIVFIFDPVMFALLAAGLVAPWLFGLVGSEVGARKQRFRPRGWAIAALLGVVGWWGLREVEHARALQIAMAQSIAMPAQSIAESAQNIAEPTQSFAAPVQSTVMLAAARNPAQDSAHDLTPEGPAPSEPLPVYLQTQRALVNPDPLSPFHWSAAMDFGPVYQLAEIDTRSGTVTMGETTYPTPGRSRTVLAAERSKLGRVYMDWSMMPIVQVTGAGNGPDSALAEATGSEGGALEGIQTVVTFRDLRFMGGWLGQTRRSALSGAVGLSAEGRVVRQTMDGRVER